MTNPAASQRFVTVVSGLPRSGTSMMMRMLETGGIPVVVDNLREADEDNPRGYYEFEPVKKTKEDPSWIEQAYGKAVKMVYLLLYDLPEDHDFRVVFMRRKLQEVIASQNTMLNRHERDKGPEDQLMMDIFDKDLQKVDQWLKARPRMRVLYVDYNEMLEDPGQQIAEIEHFLELSLDKEQMRAVVEPSLYRNRR